MEVYHHALLISTLVGGERIISRFGCFTTGGRAPGKGVSGSQCRSERDGEGEQSCPCRRSNPITTHYSGNDQFTITDTGTDCQQNGNIILTVGSDDVLKEDTCVDSLDLCMQVHNSSHRCLYLKDFSKCKL
jgi:hypothetical protein